ncbi:MAG: hypothetical protein ACRCTP_04805 [Aeromonas popoffii]|uniref:hypothetical protein n=1 Tax=Aeromonas popoffii TaxID=70856 RepID=UPI003F34D089
MTNFNITAKTSLNTIATRINELTNLMALSGLEIGALLAAAKERFQTADLFLDWAEKETGYKKTQVYRFLQIDRDFGGKEWAAEMSTGALVALIGSSEAVKKVVETIVKSGETVTAGDVKDIKKEEAGDSLPEANTPPKPEVKPLTEKELTKALDKANKAAEVEKQRHSVQIEKAKVAKDKAIEEQRKALTDLEKAQAVITKLAAENETLKARIAELEALANPVGEVVEELAADDLPWNDDEVNTSVQLAEFEKTYNLLLLDNPRKIVANTEEAAKQAGIEMEGKKFNFDGELLTGAELRALIG